jgi:hypothetical protein
VRDTIAGLFAGSLLTLIAVDVVADGIVDQHDAMRRVSIAVRSKIDTAILLAPEVAPSDVALACCVGE